MIGIVQIEDGLSVKGNLKLESLKGLDNIKSIVGDLVISECRVKSLEGLNAINSIIGTLSIYNNSFLFDWCALKNLFQNDGLNGGHFFANCSYNPKAEDIALGNCKP